MGLRSCSARPGEADDKLISFRCMIIVNTSALRVVSLRGAWWGGERCDVVTAPTLARHTVTRLFILVSGVT